MPAEAWVALGIGMVTMVGSVFAAGWWLSSKLAQALTTFTLIGTQQASEISTLKVAVEKIETAIVQIAVDRERNAALEHRVSKLEQWYDELRRGIGRIES